MSRPKGSTNKINKDNFTVTVDIVGNKYMAVGKTVVEALKALNLTWENIKNKGLVTVEKNGNKIEHLFYLGQMKKLFAIKLNKELWGKRLELLFNSKYDNL